MAWEKKYTPTLMPAAEAPERLARKYLSRFMVPWPYPRKPRRSMAKSTPAALTWVQSISPSCSDTSMPDSESVTPFLTYVSRPFSFSTTQVQS